MTVARECSEILLAFVFFFLEIRDILFTYFFCETFWDEIILCLRPANLDDISFFSDIRDASEEPDRNLIFIWSHERE